MSASILDFKNRPNLFGLILANQEPKTPLHTLKEHWVYDGKLLLDQRLAELQQCLDTGIFTAAPEDYPCSSLELPCHYVNASSTLLAIAETLRQLPEDARGLLITDYNQPLVDKADFFSLIEAWEKSPETLIYTRSRHQTMMMPAIIPAELFSTLWLLATEGKKEDWLESIAQNYPKVSSINLTGANITMEHLSVTNKEWTEDCAMIELIH